MSNLIGHLDDETTDVWAHGRILITAFDKLRDWRTTAGAPYDEPAEVQKLGDAETRFAAFERMLDAGTGNEYDLYWAEDRLEEILEGLCPPGTRFGRKVLPFPYLKRSVGFYPTNEVQIDP